MHINETGGDRSRIGLDPGRQTPRSARVSDTGASEFSAAFAAAGIRAGDHVSLSTDVEPIPAALWADVDRASALVDALAERGQAVRFSMNESTGKVVAGLYDNTGRQLQPIGLTDLIPDPQSSDSLDLTAI